MTNAPKRPSRRARLIALALGMAVGVSCYWVPPDYQTVCAALAKVVSTACGG